jgi:hypothetical protein
LLCITQGKLVLMSFDNKTCLEIIIHVTAREKRVNEPWCHVVVESKCKLKMLKVHVISR